MYIIIKTEEPENVRIKVDDPMTHYFCADNLNEAKMSLEKLENMSVPENRSEYRSNSDLKDQEDFNNYLRQIILEPNKLSDTEIRDLGMECLVWAHMDIDKYRKFSIGVSSTAISFVGNDFRRYWENLVYIINEYTESKNNIPPWTVRDDDFNPIKDLGLIFPFQEDPDRLCHKSACGTLNMRFYKLLYYFDFLGIKIRNPRLQAFWKFYKKTMNVYAVGLKAWSWGNDICIVPKPDEIYVKDDVTHCIYNGDCYCNGIRVPRWLYNTTREKLNINKIRSIKNVDYRTIFIKKAGIGKFVKKGKVIDSWENYPDNEWWAKSEYKLIDMASVIGTEFNRNPQGGYWYVQAFDYAPYLCMKNQTTGEYHLEGVSPNCRDLYDALKMRYSGLDLPCYEIKDIK